MTERISGISLPPNRTFAASVCERYFIKRLGEHASPDDESEEKQRRLEYSEMLKRLPYSDLSADCDPEKDSAYTALILHWQYEQSF